MDEYGSTEGIVTLEDVLEEMVGDIRDEFDSFSGEMIKKSGDGFRVDGRCSLHALVQRVPDLRIDHAEEEADTVGGYVSHLIGHLPAKGDTIDAENFRWTVTSSDMRRVREVTVKPLETLVEEPEKASE